MPDIAQRSGPLLIEEQGSFAVGGVRLEGPNGHTLHGDHAYVTYQIPVDARRMPLAFLHGHLQFSKTWGTTPDGREGYQNIFLRRGYGVYLIEQPRRGNAGQSTLPITLAATPEDQVWFDVFRVGIWPDFFPGVQFSRDPAALEQYFRQTTPNTGPFDLDVAADAVVALFDRIGPAVLVTHSQGGGVGWRAATRSAQIRGIVSYEPGSNFPFPEGEVPAPMPSSAGPLVALGVPLDDFRRICAIPVVIYYGDYIPSEPSANPGQDQWRVRLDMARLWVAAVNRHGGNATVAHLPDLGIHGNTHFPFSDLNNLRLADLMSDFLREAGLD